jgi:Mn-dependent DtxR family transcriptional regulator
MHHNETLARRIVAEVEQVTDGRPMRWVALQQVARRLKVHRSSAATAVRVAVDGGWLIGEGEPPHSVCLTDAGRAMAASVAEHKHQPGSSAER